MREPSYKVKCSCVHEFQDAQYGKGVRIANPVNKSRSAGKLAEVKCTVCGAVHRNWSNN